MKLGSLVVKPGAMVLTDVGSDGVPHFGCIEELFVDCTQQVFAGLRLADTVEYSSHLHSWVLSPKDTIFLCPLSNPTLCLPRTVCGSPGLVYITLKHALCSI